ncbi:PilZ domain-containing protein [Tsuneonella sp. SYSU-LHT278]|uniref:PilZ domain-containing protein n=1 Tax=Tsuneonella sediminis TaxID=3416089 RepID=UPI003F7A1E16
MEPLRSHEPETVVDRRACRRVQTTCPAILQTMTTLTTGTLADISVSGARFEAVDPPGAGATALLRWGDHEAVCTIVWSEHDSCGVVFKQALSAEVVAETAALTRVREVPIASVGNITQGRRRSSTFRKTPAVEQPAVASTPLPGPASSLAEVLARFRRGGPAGY